MKKIIVLIILAVFLFGPVFVSAETALTSAQLKQQLIQTIERLIAQLQQQLNTMLAQQAAVKPPVITQPSTSTCTPNWQCGIWNTCYNGQQTRSCFDYNNCVASTGKPTTAQVCTTASCNYDSDCGTSGPTGDPFCQSGNVYQIYAAHICNNPGTSLSSCSGSTVAQLKTACTTGQICRNGSCNCTPNWSCSGFGSCVNGVETQTCFDTNACSSGTNEPSLAQACNYSNSYNNTNCTSNWKCYDWNSCYNGQQTRYCYDTNFCGGIAGEPATTQTCTCATNWQCNIWSPCYASQQTRYCYDYNNCGTTVGRPVMTQSCS